jgi:hypothetical protein
MHFIPVLVRCTRKNPATLAAMQFSSFPLAGIRRMSE